jgi:endonuclease YncB( thermonuclease family)
LANSGQADRSFINTKPGYDFVELINKITMSKPFAFSAAALLSPWCRALGIAWLALGSLGLAGAEELQGRVVKVADGDTITVLDGQRQQHVIRLGGIDAPEKSQPYGQKAKAHLSNAVFGQTVTVTFDKRDRYGRIVGKVLIRGEDANLQQLQAGWAWHYKQYQREQAPEDRSIYDGAERAARESRLGLWQGQGPTSPEPPWDYRARLKSERQSAQNHTTLPESSLQ